MKVHRNSAYVVELMKSYMRLGVVAPSIFRVRSEVIGGRRKSGCRRSPVCCVADPLESRISPITSSWPDMHVSSEGPSIEESNNDYSKAEEPKKD
jgi:hypothetical protein